jgi:hypothetical protein
MPATSHEKVTPTGFGNILFPVNVPLYPCTTKIFLPEHFILFLNRLVLKKMNFKAKKPGAVPGFLILLPLPHMFICNYS